jgi:hypothetical protein
MLHHGRRRAVPQGGGGGEGGKRTIHTFDVGEIGTEITVGYKAYISADDTHGASVITIYGGADQLTLGQNHGAGFNDHKFNMAYYAQASQAYEVWDGIDPITGADSNDHDAPAFTGGGVPRRYLFRLKAGLPWQVFYEGNLIHTYAGIFAHNFSALAMEVFVGGFTPFNSNTDSAGTLYKGVVFDRYIPDEEIADAFALLA